MQKAVLAYTGDKDSAKIVERLGQSPLRNELGYLSDAIADLALEKQGAAIDHGGVRGRRADDIRTVAHADAREVIAVLPGVVIGAETGGLDPAADSQVHHIHGGGDVAVDEHAGDIAGGVLDQDGLARSQSSPRCPSV